MSNDSTKGWLKLHRASEDNDLYFSEAFTRWQAWQDILLLTNHKDSVAFIRGVQIPVKKGQSAHAVKTLAFRWKWSATKVNNFLEYLKKRNQIEVQKTNVTTIITVINWDKYQEEVNQTLPQKETRKKPEVNQKETNKNEENNTNSLESAVALRAHTFQNQVAQFVNQYDKKMLRAFYDYWTEKNKTGTKMKFEMERTFEVSKRLATWAGRETGYKKDLPKPQAHHYTSVGN